MQQELTDKYAELLSQRRPHESRTPQEDSRINADLWVVRSQMLLADPNLQERIALACLIAGDLKEESCVHGRYTATEEECMKRAFEATRAPAELHYPFSLAMYWGNDLETWADDTLSGGSVTKYWEKHASREDRELSKPAST